MAHEPEDLIKTIRSTELGRRGLSREPMGPSSP